MNQEYLNLLIESLDLHNQNVDSMAELMRIAAKSSRELIAFEKEHPDLAENKTDYLKEAQKILRTTRIKEYYKNLPDFNGNPDKIPTLPLWPKEDMMKYIWPGLIRAGAIPKKDLIPGHTYLGDCRNASKATWDGQKFTYIRYKFGFSYPETINHFQDDNGYDVFTPIKDITDEEQRI